MSVLSGRRTPSPTTDRTRSDAAAPGSTGSRIPAPHFRPAPAVETASLEEARLVLEDLRVHLAELEQRELSLNSQLSALDREQRALRLQTQQFAADSAELQQILERREQELAGRQEALDAQQAGIDRQRETLRAELFADVADARQEIDSGRAELLHDRAELEDEIARRRSEMDSAAAQLTVETIETKRALASQQSEIDRQRASLRAELLAELAEERRQLAADREELDQGRAELADELAQRLAGREQEITEHTALLAQLREEQLADVEIREADVTQREVDLVRRTKFQEEHLSRLRSAIEGKQADLERDRAAKAVWSAEVDASIRNRLSHLRKFRELLEGREGACDAAWQTLAEAQAQQQAMLVDLRLYVSDEQRALAEQQDAVAGDLRRHAELMRLREEELERRSARTDAFRDELARRHFDLAGRETALLGARDWLVDQIGPEAVQRLLPRDLPASPVDSTADHHRREIADGERALADWQHELQRERAEFAQRTVDREERLRARESSLAWQWEQLTAREAALQAAQLRDRADR
ncbi:MAG: hypothetical protein JNG89_06130, partial [Planctomycetaceae bacterium]|nr:hypothetical protein [Planctomycetaceae bacterium]